MRRLLPRSVRGRLLVLVAIVVGGALAIMTVGFNILLARSLDGDATRLAHSRASTILATVRISDGAVKISETQDDAAVDSEAWVFNRTRIVEAPHASAATNAAAHVLARSDIRSLDSGDLRLFATPIVSDGNRIGTVVAGVALAPYEQTRKTALELSADVCTLNVLARYVFATGFVSPAIVSVAAVVGASAHPAPASVIVAVCAAAVAVAVQLTKPALSAIAGMAGTVKPALKATVIVDPDASVPVALEVKPTVQSERARPVCGEPVNDTVVTDGSIVYGSGSSASLRRSSRNQPSFAWRSDQRAPAGVTA